MSDTKKQQQSENTQTKQQPQTTNVHFLTESGHNVYSQLQSIATNLSPEQCWGLASLYDDVEAIITSGQKKYTSVEMMKRKMLKDVLGLFGVDTDSLRRERKVRTLEERLESMSPEQRKALLEKYAK